MPTEQRDKGYIVHMTLKDNEDGELFVIENEFDADNWVSAWHHVMGIPAKFNATLVSHKLRAVDKKSGKLSDPGKDDAMPPSLALLPPPSAPPVRPARPAAASSAYKYTPPAVPVWATAADVKSFDIIPLQ